MFVDCGSASGYGAEYVRTIVNILRYVTQFVVLLKFRSFYYYLIVAIIGTIVTNLGIQCIGCKKISIF